MSELVLGCGPDHISRTAEAAVVKFCTVAGYIKR